MSGRVSAPGDLDQGTGHNAGALDTLANTILVKTQELRGVEIDAAARVAGYMMFGVGSR